MDIVPPLPEDCERDTQYKSYRDFSLKEKLHRLKEKYGDHVSLLLEEVESILDEYKFEDAPKEKKDVCTKIRTTF